MSTHGPGAAVYGLHLAWLWAASLLVPAAGRGEWRREWRSELWHVRQACTRQGGVSFRTKLRAGLRAELKAELEVAKFSLGAFADALCLRREVGRRHIPDATTPHATIPYATIPYATTRGSAGQCLLLLAGMAVASAGIALVLPGLRVARHVSAYRDAGNLLLIRDARVAADSVPTISGEQYRAWKRRRQDIFDGFAFYQVIQAAGVQGIKATPAQVSKAAGAQGIKATGADASRGPAAGSIAVASANLFELLGVPVRFADAEAEAQAQRGVPRLILSDETWKRAFAGDRHISGRVVELDGTSAVVGGIAPPGSWRLPGKVDGWLLVAEGASVPDRMGFVVAHLEPSSTHSGWGQSWGMSAPEPDGTMADFSCAPLLERSRGSKDIFLFAVFLACLALPATTSLPLGEYRVNSHPLSWSTRLRRWGFLGAKIALLLPIVYFVSLDLAHLRTSVDPFRSEYIQLASAFALCLFGLRWVLRDQRQRCPVCLGRLTHPARVGHPSRSFLAWNGTELICVGGHGLLHIPEMQTSWFNTQRWLYLDPSWEVLFAEPGLASAGYF